MNLKKLAAAVILLLTSAELFANSSAPRIVFYERNPWLMVIGSDSPIFAAYDSGQVIWWSGTSSENGHYDFVNLGQNEYSDLVSKFGSAAALDPYYKIASVTDQPTEELHVVVAGTKRTFEVYGSLGDNKIRARAPAAIVRLYDYMKQFQHAGSKAWVPEFVEVMVWPYDYAKGKSIPWPKGWPDTKSSSTRKRREAYSIFLPYSKNQELLQILRTTAGKDAIEINGKKWAVATRIPFPHEYPK